MAGGGATSLCSQHTEVWLKCEIVVDRLLRVSGSPALNHGPTKLVTKRGKYTSLGNPDRSKLDCQICIWGWTRVVDEAGRDRVTFSLNFYHLTRFSFSLTRAFLTVAFLSISRVLHRSRLAIRKMSTLPNIPGTDPSKCILDSFRAAIARQVADALPPLTPEQVYTGVDYGRKGKDFTIALPRFRLPGKPDDLGKKVVENVSAIA